MSHCFIVCFLKCKVDDIYLFSYETLPYIVTKHLLLTVCKCRLHTSSHVHFKSKKKLLVVRKTNSYV